MTWRSPPGLGASCMLNVSATWSPPLRMGSDLRAASRDGRRHRGRFTSMPPVPGSTPVKAGASSAPNIAYGEAAAAARFASESVGASSRRLRPKTRKASARVVVVEASVASEVRRDNPPRGSCPVRPGMPAAAVACEPSPAIAASGAWRTSGAVVRFVAAAASAAPGSSGSPGGTRPANGTPAMAVWSEPGWPDVWPDAADPEPAWSEPGWPDPPAVEPADPEPDDALPPADARLPPAEPPGPRVLPEPPPVPAEPVVPPVGPPAAGSVEPDVAVGRGVGVGATVAAGLG